MRGNLIRERKKLGLSQTEAAKLISLGLRQYKSLESGTSDGSVKVWQRLKALTHKSIDYLLEQEPIAKEPGGNRAKSSATKE